LTVDPDVRRLFEELAQLNRELLNRFDRSWKTIDRRIEKQIVQLELLQAETRENTLAARDMREEMKAQRTGFLALIDEIRGQQGSA
jgi:hypothetical protein